jgi:anti-anti-sigma regulatory factor
VTLWYDGPSFFAEVPSITEQLPRPAPGQAPSVVVINCVLLHNLSSTMVKSLLGYHRDLRSEGCGLVLTGVEAGQRQILRDTGLLDEVGDANVIEADSHIGANVERGHGRGTALLAELRAQRAAATQT